MRSMRRVRLLSTAAITGLGASLFLTVGVTTTSVPAAGDEIRPINVQHNRALVATMERRRESKSYLAARARYYDARRLAGRHPISVEQAAAYRSQAAAQRQRLSPSPANDRSARPAITANPQWQPLPETATLQNGRTTGNFQAVSGRVSALAMDHAGHIFLGAAQGGVWRYDPKAGTWTPLTDSLGSLATGAIAVAPSNDKVVYVGTGEGDLSGDSYFGDGVYRSADGGNTWRHVNGGEPFIGTSISRIVVDPRHPNTVYVATIRGKAGVRRVTSPFKNTWGIYKSTNGGRSWSRLWVTHEVDGGATDLVLDPHNPTTLYASFWGAGIYKATAAGHQRNWKKIMDGLPTGQYDALPTRFAITATALGKQTRLYAGFEYVDTKGHYHPSRIYRSDQGGKNWKALPTEGPLKQVDSVLNYCATQCDYDNVVVADPAHPDTVYVGGQYSYATGSGGIYRSMDGGKTWRSLGLDLHPDFHAIALQPGHHTHVAIGNDGGIWYSSVQGGRRGSHKNFGAVHWDDLNVGLDTTQMDSIDYSDHPPFESDTHGPVYYAGTQDNGTQIGPLGTRTWIDVGGGDGGVAFVDRANPQYVFGTFYGISPYRFDDAGGGYHVTPEGGVIQPFTQTPIDNGINKKDRAEFYVPWVQNELHTNQLFLGTYRLYRADNAEAAAAADVKWRPISGDLTTGCLGAAPNTGRGCLISAIGVSGGGTGVYVGTEEGLVQVADDATVNDSPSWQLRNTGLPQRPVTSFGVDKSNWRIAYVAFGGFGRTTPGRRGHVFRTTDGGQTWTRASGVAGSRLPDNPVNDVVMDPSDRHTAWAATDVGTFVTHDDGRHWHELATGMPTVAVWSMKWDPSRTGGGVLVAGTHGRGGWTLDTGLQRPALVATTGTDDTPVGPGSLINYTVTVRNIGNATASNVQVTQRLAPHTTAETVNDGGTVSPDGKSIVWQVPAIAAGDSATVSFSARISDHLASTVDQIVADHLSVTAYDAADNFYRTTGSPEVKKLSPPYLVTVKPKRQTDGARSGGNVTYSMTVTNRGYRSDTYDLSAGTTHWDTSIYESDCATPISATRSLAPGESQDICVSVQVPADALDSERDNEVVTATSENDPRVSDSGTVTTIAVTVTTLLVDEDGSTARNGAPDVRSYYTQALTAAGVRFATWDLTADPVLPPGYLNAHTQVYWFTGTSYPFPLGHYEAELTHYLDQGNNLFLSGMDILDQAAGSTQFVHDYLHVNWDGSEQQNDKATAALQGESGSAIGGQFGSVPLVLPPGYGEYEDQITPIPPAETQFRDDSGQPDGLAVRDASSTSSSLYQVVFLAFPFEAFGGSADRAHLVRAVQDYFAN